MFEDEQNKTINEAPAEATETTGATETTETTETTEAIETTEAVETPQAAEAVEPLAAKPGDKKEKKTRKTVNISPKYFIFAGLAIILAAGIALFVFLLPANRVKRYTAAGNKQFAKENYEKAMDSFEHAIKLDEFHFTARNGKLLSMAAINKRGAEDEAYEALGAIARKKASLSEKETAECIELFLTATEMLKSYDKSGSGYMARIDEAYDALSKAEELTPAVADACVKYADVLGTAGDDGALKITLLERAYDLTNGSESVTERGRDAVTSYISSLVKIDKYTEAYQYLSNYYNKFKLDRDTIKAEISKAEELYSAKTELLSNVYKAMEPCYSMLKGNFSKEGREQIDGMDFGLFSYDWLDMLMLDGSDYAQLVSVNCDENGACFAKDGFSADYTGTACALYPYGEKFINEEGKEVVSYYFFFGDFVNGKREGYGICFIKTGTSSYYCFEGTWTNDAPNGFGVYYRRNTYAYTSLAEYTEVTFGNYVDGYQDGKVIVRITANEQPGTIFEGSYNVTNGEPETVPVSTEFYEVLSEIPEGYSLIAVVPSITDGYSNYMTYRNPDGVKKGAIGYE